MEGIRILWADDEIDHLKPHIMFLEQKGYQVEAVASGDEAVEASREQAFNVIFLDENMPGMTGLETLEAIKQQTPDIPVVMITKSEEEYLMDDAIGSQIADYLIKPVNPKQILLSLKKLIDNKRLVSAKVLQSYQQEFMQLSSKLNDNLTADEWIDAYRKLIYWELELEKSDAEGMADVLNMQKTEANANFFRFISDNYPDWMKQPDTAPVMSHTLLGKKLMPVVEESDPDCSVFFLLLDNFRLDQWKAVQPYFADLFRVTEEDAFYGILPTATAYSRNAIFAGMMPADIQRRFPKYWLNDMEAGGKNMHEKEMLAEQLNRRRFDDKFSYTKITNLSGGKELADNITNLLHNKLNVVVYNFIDLLSHVRTEMDVLKELAEDESAYRSLTVSWFEHSPLKEALRKLTEKNVKIVIATDHGSIRVKSPSKVVGDRETTTNLRYKHGKSLSYNKDDVFAVRKPRLVHLPEPNVSSAFIFAKGDSYFVYPNKYHHFVNLYRDTFQHGGISMEEMIIPVITLEPK